MNTKTIQTSSPYIQLARLVKDKRSQAIIEKKLKRERITDGEIYRLQVVSSGAYFGQVLSGGF